MTNNDTERFIPIIRLLIVDDQLIVREGLKRFFVEDDRIRVIAEASNGQDAIELAVRLKPDAILMELTLSVVDGSTTVERILTVQPKAKIVILTSEIDRTQTLQLVGYGISGYLLKDIQSRQLSNAIKDVVAGYPRFDPKVLELLITSKVRRGLPSQRLDQLTPREREIMHKVVAGQTYIEIGKDLSLSHSTVKFHVSHILQKLQLTSRLQLTAFVMKHLEQHGNTSKDGR